MRYGIVEEGLNVICVGCDEVLSTNGQIPSNYCAKCGNPLTLTAIQNEEKKVEKLENNVLKDLMEISKNKKSNSFKDILETYFQDR